MPQPKPVMARLMAKVRVDDTGCWIFTGAPTPNGYGKIRDNGTTRGAHRVAYEHLVGPIPDGFVVDHRCHEQMCVNPEHLRAVTTKQNGENRTGAMANNKSSGVRGVSFAKHNKTHPWQGTVRHEGRNRHVGYFATIAEADAAVRAKRAELFTHDDHDQWVAKNKETAA